MEETLPARRKKAPIKSRRPRVPLPRQTGGAHQDKTRVLPRKQKHKKKPQVEE
jgi:hypothetical protein